MHDYFILFKLFQIFLNNFRFTCFCYCCHLKNIFLLFIQLLTQMTLLITFLLLLLLFYLFWCSATIKHTLNPLTNNIMPHCHPPVWQVNSSLWLIAKALIRRATLQCQFQMRNIQYTYIYIIGANRYTQWKAMNTKWALLRNAYVYTVICLYIEAMCVWVYVRCWRTCCM